MGQIAYYNDKPYPVHVGGKMILPGHCREVDAAAVQIPVATAEAAGPEQGDSVLDLLDGSVKDITAALPGLSEADLDQLEAAEQAGKTRKSLLEALAAERLRRAQAEAGGQGDADGNEAGPDTENGEGTARSGAE